MDDAPRESCYGSAVSEAARHRLQVDERRKQLIDLALELFGNRPYDEISIDETAKEAGVPKGLLYHYFPSKRAFFVAAVEAAAERLAASAPPLTDAQVRRLGAILGGAS